MLVAIFRIHSIHWCIVKICIKNMYIRQEICLRRFHLYHTFRTDELFLNVPNFLQKGQVYTLIVASPMGYGTAIYPCFMILRIKYSEYGIPSYFSLDSLSKYDEHVWHKTIDRLLALRPTNVSIWINDFTSKIIFISGYRKLVKNV